MDIWYNALLLSFIGDITKLLTSGNKTSKQSNNHNSTSGFAFKEFITHSL
ncbi:hypothetical protein Syun_031341 [Stephania yunnanensis]|uniref:Uncharacterized protein n=1 Tax=Stephania yunnanensis TaxID=152371 RepID=A0AAP0DTV6_9MAGN